MTDIVVVGGGGAGLSAAAEAARLGRKVTLIEKNARVGGTTGIAVGTLMAACTDMQRRAGIEDSPHRHEEEIAKLSGMLGLVDNPALLRLLTENVPDTVNFFASIGVDFIGPLFQPPFPTQRFYQALPGGRAYVRRLLIHCRRLGVAIRTGVKAERLRFEAGRVTGVETKGEIFRARAVVLASGDFSANHAMRAELLGPGADGIEAINQDSTGDGQRMAVAIGAKLARRPDLPAARLVQARFPPPARADFVASLPPWRVLTLAMKYAMTWLPNSMLRPIILRAAMTALAPERALYEEGAILVNRRGERFADEMGLPAPEIARQPEGEAFLVFDARIAEKYNRWPHYVSTAPGVAFAYVADYRRVRPDICFTAPSIEELASRISAPPAALAATVAKTKLDGPFHAMGPLKAWLLLTHTGLAVDTRLQVLSESGAPIAGLFAAGGAGQGGFNSIYHGHSLGWAFTSGRLAGRSAAFDH
jgi:succinate dehydrogenase/fumarate reductase flavoprotein subunit